jgi:hypothetical protein
MRPTKTFATLTAAFAGILLASFAASLANESQRAYASCLAKHQAPTYCRLLISGR